MSAEEFGNFIKRESIPLVIRSALYWLGYFNISHTPPYYICERCRGVWQRAAEVKGPFPGFLYQPHTSKHVMSTMDRKETEDESSVIVLQDLGDSKFTDDKSKRGTANAESCLMCDDFGFADDNTDKGTSRSSRWQVACTWFWILVMIGLFSYAIISRFNKYYGRSDKLLTFISFLFYALCMLIPVLLRMLSLPPFGRVEALSCRYIRVSLMHLDVRRYTKIGNIFLAFPVVCTVVRVAFNVIVFEQHMSPCLPNPKFTYNTAFSVVTGILGYFFFASFCYTMYLLHRAVDREINALISFVNSDGIDVPTCFRKIIGSFMRFSPLQNLLCRWMVFQLSFVTLKIYLQLRWNYAMNVNDFHHAKPLMLMITIWCEIAMFLILPVIAVGGFHIEHVWRRFRSSVNFTAAAKDLPFWDKMSVFDAKIKPPKMAGKVAFILATVSGIMAVNFGVQSVSVWSNVNHGDCFNSSVSINTTDYSNLAVNLTERF